MSGETMPERMTACRLEDTGTTDRQLYRALHGFLVLMVAGGKTGIRILTKRTRWKDILPTPLC